MKRLQQFILIGSILPLSWLAMMAVHEAGHVAGAWFTGGTIAKVVLHPLTILTRTGPRHQSAPAAGHMGWTGSRCRSPPDRLRHRCHGQGHRVPTSCDSSPGFVWSPTGRTSAWARSRRRGRRRRRHAAPRQWHLAVVGLRGDHGSPGSAVLARPGPAVRHGKG